MSSLRETEDLLNDTSAGFFVGGAIGLKGALFWFIFFRR